MRNNFDLHKLIQSLSKAEKRAFKMYASLHSKKDSNNYIVLFDTIEKQTVYDEGKLKRKLRKYTFVKTLAKTKFLLHEFILKTLDHLHHNKSIESKLFNLLDQSKILKSKTLYSQSYVLLDKADQTANRFELYFFLQQIIREKKSLVPYLPKKKISLRELREESRYINGLLDIESKYELFYDEVLAQYEALKKGIVPLDELKEIYSELLESPFLRKKGNAISFLSKVYFHEIHALCAKVILDIPKATKHLRQLEELWDNNFEKTSVYREEFLRSIVNIVTYYLEANIEFDFKGILEKIKSLTTNVAQDVEKNLFFASAINFIYSVTNQQLEYSNIQLMTMRQSIDDHAEKLKPELMVAFYYHIAIYHFLRTEYEEALKWINKIDGTPYEQCHCIQTRNYCKLMSLIAKYELKQHFILESEVRSTYRRLRKEQYGQIEKIVIATVKKLIKVADRKSATEIFEKTHSQLQYLQDEKDTQELGTNAIYQWVYANING